MSDDWMMGAGFAAKFAGCRQHVECLLRCHLAGSAFAI